MPMAIDRWRRWLEEPIDGAGLAAFRVMFGAMMCASTVRYWANGWIDTILRDPSYHFTYPGFSWVRPLGGPWGELHFGAMLLAAACIMLGIKARAASAIFFALFTYVELIEKAAYLNHYVLVSFLALLLACIRTDSAWALWPERGPAPTSRWCQWVFRVQVAAVYFWAGVAKLNPDWLGRGEPLYTWLQAYHHWPLIGEWLVGRPAALAMSWGGAIFDLTIWAWLLWPNTRRPAYAVAVGFHVIVWVMFPIGVFPWVMLSAATLMFAPDWPRRFMRRARPDALVASPLTPLKTSVAVGWLVVQLLMPARSVLYDGPVNWNEQGFRFAWRVMLVEKTGQLEYRVVSADRTQRWRIYPRTELTRQQYKMLCVKPDMIAEYAREIARRFAARGHPDVSVYADAFVSYNGRSSQRWVDPNADLSDTSPWGTAEYILPMVEE